MPLRTFGQSLAGRKTVRAIFFALNVFDRSLKYWWWSGLLIPVKSAATRRSVISDASLSVAPFVAVQLFVTKSHSSFKWPSLLFAWISCTIYRWNYLIIRPIGMYLNIFVNMYVDSWLYVSPSPLKFFFPNSFNFITTESALWDGEFGFSFFIRFGAWITMFEHENALKKTFKFDYSSLFWEMYWPQTLPVKMNSFRLFAEKIINNMTKFDVTFMHTNTKLSMFAPNDIKCVTTVMGTQTERWRH